MESAKPVRIAITGPESTGKSALCRRLAEHFNEPWVPEYSREYLENLGGAYRFGDILAIAHGQFEREMAQLQHARRYLFCDTDFLVTHIWCKVKFNKTHEWINKMASEHPYDFTLLCNIDLPWEFDPLRENPDNRDYLYNLYVEELSKRSIPYAVVEGFGEERFVNAIKILEKQGFYSDER